MAENDETFTKEQVQELLTKQQADFDTKLSDTTKKLQDEAAKSRISKDDVLKTFAEKLGMEYNPDKKPDKDVFAEQIEVMKAKQKDLEDKYLGAEQAKTKLERQAKAKELAIEAGLKAKAVKLMNLDAESLENEIKRVSDEFPELKEKVNVGTGSNPADTGNSVTANPYKTESFNLTQQFKLESSNPALAAKFKAEAGIK